MVPHLVRAQSTYNIRIQSFHHRRMHTHTTNTCITADGSVKHQYAEEKRWVFIIFPGVRIVRRRWEFEMSGTVVQDNLACLLWLKTQTTAETVPPLFCHTNQCFAAMVLCVELWAKLLDVVQVS